MRDDDTNPLKSKLVVQDDGDFRYTGGHGNNGHLRAKDGIGEVTFQIDVVGNRWTIDTVEILGDHQGQLSKPAIQGRTALIFDANTEEMQANYCVSVRGEDGRVIRCDPMISNDPRGHI